MTSDAITITIPRRFLEHPEAHHIRKIRAAIWLYLVLAARLPESADTIEVVPSELARRMGVPDGTIRTWLGHLQKHRYIETRRLNAGIEVRIKHAIPAEPAGPLTTPAPEAPGRFFTVAKLGHALGDTGNGKSLADALENHPDAVIRKALAATLAVPDSEIRRSRTALFLYLLKRHAEED